VQIRAARWPARSCEARRRSPCIALPPALVYRSLWAPLAQSPSTGRYTVYTTLFDTHLHSPSRRCTFCAKTMARHVNEEDSCILVELRSTFCGCAESPARRAVVSLSSISYTIQEGQMRVCMCVSRRVGESSFLDTYIAPTNSGSFILLNESSTDVCSLYSRTALSAGNSFASSMVGHQNKTRSH